VRFAELFESAASRTEVICTFLALLELIRLRQLVCSQPEPFAEIEIRRATPTAAGAPVPAAPKLPSEGWSDPAATPAPEPVPAAAETSPQSPTPINREHATKAGVRNPQSS
jgi:hypothetical protein